MSILLFYRGVGIPNRLNAALSVHLFSSCAVNNASINSGINRGLRRSQGVGFRGKEKKDLSRGTNVTPWPRHDRWDKSRNSRPDDKGFNSKNKYNGGGSPNRDGLDRDSQSRGFQIPGENASRYGPARQNGGRSNVSSFRNSKSGDRDGPRPSHGGKSYETRDKGRSDPFEKKPFERKSYESQDSFSSSNKSFEKEPFERRYSQSSLSSPKKPFEGRSFDKKPFEKRPYGSQDTFSSSRPPYEKKPFERKSYDSQDSFSPRPSFEKKPFEKRPYNPQDSFSSSRPPFEKKPFERRSHDSQELASSARKPFEKRPFMRETFNKEPFNSPGYSSTTPTNVGATGNQSESYGLPESTYDKTMPITIPYTTPASEFLYGTSVVELALGSNARKHRRLYKLYIHKGEAARKSGRDMRDVRERRDGVIAKMAEKRGVEVHEVGGPVWLRTLDKMSNGRPHNGYILEASPLPRLPITSLGELIDRDDGGLSLKVNLDHQSKEEAQVNGTSDLIKIHKDAAGRNPLVLFLDSIEDPQNLGAIVRTASFMGITAVAVSTRNSSSFTPVVLKASAGAAENMELFTVNSANKFLIDSKAAGWKVYAAVAPTAVKMDRSEMYTEDLRNPLAEDPCILMLGGEGDGLKWDLKAQADVRLSIKGSGRAGKLDSLNVSVATGILCDAFMRQQKTAEEAVKEVEEEMKVLPENKLF